MFEREGHLLGIGFELDTMNLECVDDGKYTPVLVVDSTACNALVWRMFPVLIDGTIDLANPLTN
jgi:hypothetical protein